MPLKRGKDMLRVNLSLEDVPMHLDGVVFECVASDVSLAREVAQYRLKVYGKIQIVLTDSQCLSVLNQ